MKDLFEDISELDNELSQLRDILKSNLKTWTIRSKKDLVDLKNILVSPRYSIYAEIPRDLHIIDKTKKYEKFSAYKYAKENFKGNNAFLFRVEKYYPSLFFRYEPEKIWWRLSWKHESLPWWMVNEKLLLKNNNYSRLSLVFDVSTSCVEKQLEEIGFNLKHIRDNTFNIIK